MNEVDVAQLLTDLGPVGLLALFVVILVKGRYVVLRRELDHLQESCDERVKELKLEKAEYRAMAFKAVGLGEQLVDVAKDQKP